MQCACSRGFRQSFPHIFPTGSLSYVHTFSPTILNELHVGYTQNNAGNGSTIPGVPQLGFGGALDDSTMGFGSYTGYPQ